MSDKEKPKSKREQQRNELLNSIDEEYLLSDINIDYDMAEYLASKEDLPMLGEVIIHDYQNDEEVSLKQAEETVEALVDLYLSDYPHLRDNKYVKMKMKQDATAYGDAIFLTKMTRRALSNQLRQVDNGDNSARMHEVINQTMTQVRENSKFLTNKSLEMESNYRLLLNDIQTLSASINTKAESEEDDGDIIDMRKFNELIKETMIKRDENNRK